MKTFEIPEIEILRFDIQDVITTSETDFIPGVDEFPLA